MLRFFSSLALITALLGCSDSESSLPLVINEVRATPVEYVEVLNLGDTLVPLTNVVLVDSDEEGRPIDANRAPLPDIGLRPGERLVVLLGQDASDGILHLGSIECPVVGLVDCGHAAFRLRATDGETLHMLEGDKRIDRVVLPPSAVPEGDSYCRIPDGTGDFVGCAPTPSATND